MPQNKNALLRYRTIDKCLQNRFRRWTLDDLIEACSDALYEFEGIDKGVSKRSIQADIQLMRSDKLGYNAPIVVQNKKYYSYADPDYSISNIPLSNEDLRKLNQALGILKQFKGFSHFRQMEGMIQRLEDKIISEEQQQSAIIDFEKNEDLRGLEHLDFIYQAIAQRKVLQIVYQSYKAKQPSTFHFHPYRLKEYRNRWFVLGLRKKEAPLLNLALDRIQQLQTCDLPYHGKHGIDLENYYKDIIGVTITGPRPVPVVFKTSAAMTPYIISKPFHHSQKILETDDEGRTTFQITVIPNFELERLLLGYAESLQVLRPRRLKSRLRKRLQEAVEQYVTR
ncbi:MAG: WYL domain-containing protein [Bacteroidota bacterium]